MNEAIKQQVADLIAGSNDKALEGISTCAAATTGVAVTPADIKRMVEIIMNVPPEPIGEWMRSQGCPPEQWAVVFPKSLLEHIEAPAAWPHYVSFSDWVKFPVFMKQPWRDL